MIRTPYKCLVVFSLLTLLSACGGNDMPEEFQQNHPSQFELTAITDGYGAVDSAWNSIDSKGVNDRLQTAVDRSGGEFEVSSYSFADLCGDQNAALADLVRTDLAGLTAQLTDTQNRHREKSNVDSFYQESAGVYARDLYAFLDRMSGDGLEVPDDYLSGLLDHVIREIITAADQNHPGKPAKTWLYDQARDLVDDLMDPDFQGDFIDIAKVISKAGIQTDYPMWVDETGALIEYSDDIDPSIDTSLNLGNAVQGTHHLLRWVDELIRDPETRPLLHGTVAGLADTFNPYPEDELSDKLRRWIVNVEDHFTVGGEVYASDPTYSEDSAAVYSDAELGRTLREMMPMLQQLFVRSDRAKAMIANQPGQTPVYPLDLMAANLRGIGFDPDTIDVERSIYDLLRYDIWGRDRLNDDEAWPASFLESLLFLTQATSNHGWQDGGSTGEYDTSVLSTIRYGNHGHGAYTEELTLNDSLFSINMLKKNLAGSPSGIWELALRPTDGNHIYRSKTPFTLSQVNDLYDGVVADDSGDGTEDIDYRFFYNQNYGVLQFLAGPGAGDLGAPDGGNPDGNPAGATPAQLMNQYRAYAPSGLHETQLSAWTMGWVVRACFHGEGPYYYADPKAETVSVDGQPYQRFLRPDGKTYALVSMDGSQYLYPAEDSDVQDPETAVLPYNNKRQRDNRYKSQWHSDAYVIQFQSTIDSRLRYVTIDNSNGFTEATEIEPTDLERPAGRLTYHESVAENDSNRACASAEEAFFRNYQWVMTEKKMVLVIPLYLDFNGISLLNAGAYQVMEANGYMGLADMRKLGNGSNHVWAKNGETGLSTIPGDYRVEMVAIPVDYPNIEELLGADTIYDETLDCGNATPSIVGHNLPALCRLAFPRSVDPPGTFDDKMLGSQEFEVGDENWNNRNAFAPILFSLLAGLRDYSPAYDPNHRPGVNAGMRTFLNQTAILIKPLFYYNKTNAPGPYDSWTARVYGTKEPGDAYQGAPFLKSSADFYSGTPDTWFGSWQERRFYQPAVMKTMLNVLIDSDLTDPRQRCNGILPLVTDTRGLTNLLKLLLNPSHEALPLEQLISAVKFTKGELTAINESPASGKGMDYPEWMFAVGEGTDEFGAYTSYSGVRQDGPSGQGEDDIILDDILDLIIGHDNIVNSGTGKILEEGYGLAHYPDDKPLDEDWQDFYDMVGIVADLLHESSPNSITPNLLYLMDRAFGRDQLYTSQEITGLLYSVGKLFGHYDAGLGRWVYQGEPQFNDSATHNSNNLYNMLTQRVQSMNTVVTQNEEDPLGPAALPGTYVYGDHYYAQLIVLANMTGSDELVQFLLNTVTAPEDWETIFADLKSFLSGPDIHDADSPLWPTLSQLLNDMGRAYGQSHDTGLLNNILAEYGFQVN